MRRTTLGLLLLSTLIACGTEYQAGGTDQPGAPDASVGTDGGALPPPARGFQVTSSNIVIEPGEEVTYCYYFRTPNTEPMAINKWTSSMTPGSHHMIMFTTGSTDKQPPGTVSTEGCGISATAAGAPVWTYAAQTQDAEVTLPADDGTGKPLAQEIAPNTAGFFQMHYLNASDAPLTVSVTLNAEALPASEAYTPTAAYITYNGAISIPDNSNDLAITQTCSTPPNMKFWSMSTHAHKQAISTQVKSGAAASPDVVFASTDWEHPGAETWMAAPFRTFADDKLTFTCTYDNFTGRTITDGDSALRDEMCMATGYMFPATKPTICYCYGAGCINI
jgi:Copper type II ascorbate-dependent monooxygenase, C-terminal domain